MFRRMLHLMVITVAAIPLVLEPALAAPPAYIGKSAIRAEAQPDAINVGMRQCTKRIRTNCMEGRSAHRKSYRQRQIQRQRDAEAAAIAGLIILGTAAAIANNGYYGHRRYYGHRNYYGNRHYGNRRHYRGGGKRYVNRGGRHCAPMYSTPNPVSGRKCY